MRRSWLVPVAALGAVLLVAGVAVVFGATPDEAAEPRAPGGTSTSTAPLSPTPVERDLLPNVRSLEPRNVSIEQSGSRLSLRFDGTLANVGAGPLEVVPDNEQPCPPGQRHVSQSIYQDVDEDGRFDAAIDRQKALRPAGCLLFHPDHTHWHLDASARYALTAAEDDAVVVEQNKVSFCLRDNVRVPGVAGTAAKGRYGKCARDRIQGISIGWADVYRESLAGQELKLPRSMRDGVYCLRVEADPLDLIRESVEDDNAVARAITITGADVGPATPESCSR